MITALLLSMLVIPSAYSLIHRRAMAASGVSFFKFRGQGHPEYWAGGSTTAAGMSNCRAARQSRRFAFQRRDEWAPNLPPVAVTLLDEQRQQSLDLSQLRHPVTHCCQLVAGDLLHLAAMQPILQ